MSISMHRNVMHFMIPDVCKFTSPKFFLCTSLHLLRAIQCVKFLSIYIFLYTVPSVFGYEQKGSIHPELESVEVLRSSASPFSYSPTWRRRFLFFAPLCNIHRGNSSSVQRTL